MKDLVEMLERRLAIERAARRQAEVALREREHELAASRAEFTRLDAQQEEVIRERTAELRLARDEAIAASSAKSAFVANMSHEIRTPLTSIIGFAELMLQPGGGDGTVDRTDALHTIVRNGRHLLEVINDILDLAKIETRQMELEHVDLPLPTLLRDLTAMVAPRAQEKSLSFEVVPHLPLPAAVRCDPVRLKQILLNFLSNAIKFTAKGSVTLEMAYAADERRMTFTVADTGIGMTPAQVSRVFQPFTQADVSMTRKFGGTGLGLYISRQLAAMLGGAIRVDSGPGQGSRFHLDLLLDADGAPPELLTMEGDLIDYAHEEFAITGISIPELHGRVLLADDGIDNQRLLTAYLKQAGLAVEIAGDGQDALERALAGDFDLVLMDIQMPVMDGVEATRLLRAAGYVRPILALTANVMKSDVARYRQAGCDDVLAKPVNRDDFYEALANHLSLSNGAIAGLDDDPEFLREMQQLQEEFKASLPQQMNAVRQALRTSDWPALTSLAHNVKGTAGSYGYPRLTEIAGQIERELHAGRHARASVLCEGLILEASNACQSWTLA